MYMKAQLTKEAKKDLITGNFLKDDPALKFTVLWHRDKEVQISLDAVNKEGRHVAQLWQGYISEGDSLTITDIVKAFHITVE